MGAEKECVDKDELRVPDGGWGYVVVAAMVVVFGFTIVPMASFGLVFGEFLKSIGDETTGTTLSNGIFNTVSSFMGLVANGVLNRYSYRKVGLAGTLIYFIGAVGLIFCQNLIQIIIFFGIIQGIGFGLMVPAILSAFDAYFDDKMTVMMSLSQACMVIITMAFPQAATFIMARFGFRGTLVFLAGSVLLIFPAMASLQPVKWHMKKVPVTQLNINDTVISMDTKENFPSSEPQKDQEEPLINQNKHLSLSQKSLHQRIRRSVISLGDRVASVTTINELKDKDQDGSKQEELSVWQSFLQSMDMSLLKDPKYLNVSLGLSLCFTADMAFISVIPLMLRNYGFDSQQIALIITVFFGSDLVSRILLTIASGIFKFRNRILVLMAALLSAIFRIVLVTNDSYMWQMSILAILGFIRCFIQTPLPLVFSEEYSDQFSTAFSLYMAVNGVVSLVFGFLMSFIKSYTHSDIMVCHTLTVAFSVCVITWTIEMIICRRKQKKEDAR